MTMKRILVTGASGLLGRAVSKEFSSMGNFEVMGLAYSRAGPRLKRVDLTQGDEVRSTLQEFQPHVIVHCAAERRPEIVEKREEQTRALNVTSTEFICLEAEKLGCWVLFISTDYVFDGKSPPYQVDDQTNPLNKYGQSKLNGEHIVLKANKDNGVLRVPILYGNVEYPGESAVTVLFDKVRDKQSTGGIFHYSGRENMTKYDMAICMAEVFGLPISNIKADEKPTAGAPRPYNSQLDTGKLEKMGLLVEQTHFKSGIKACLEPHFKR